MLQAETTVRTRPFKADESVSHLAPLDRTTQVSLGGAGPALRAAVLSLIERSVLRHLLSRFLDARCPRFCSLGSVGRGSRGILGFRLGLMGVA